MDDEAGLAPAIARDVVAEASMAARSKWDAYEHYTVRGGFLENFSHWARVNDVDDLRQRDILTYLLDEVHFIGPRDLLALVRSAVESTFGADRVLGKQRTTLVMSLSDSSAIDRFRRCAVPLSGYQFCATSFPSEQLRRLLLDRLRADLGDPRARFERIVFIDDFYGSGFSLAGSETSIAGMGSVVGKIDRILHELEFEWKGDFVSPDCTFKIVCYVCSIAAKRLVDGRLQKRDEWSFHPQMLVSAASREPPDVSGLTGSGFLGSAVPVVFYYNCPNTAPAILSGSQGVLGIFPRRPRYPDVDVAGSGLVVR